MEVTNPLLTRLICSGLALALLTPPAAMAEDGKQDVSSSAQSSQTSSPPPEPGATSATQESQPVQSSRDQLPDSPETVQSQTNDQAQAPAAAQSKPQTPPQSKTQEPVGTAAAEAEGTTGDAAFKPAGAAIAPAKQKRTRMVLLKIGALVGAGVAIGSVAALSSASPSRPPGSH